MPVLSGRDDGRPTLGIVGGGQLARMLVQSAADLDVSVRVLAAAADSAAAALCPRTQVGDWNDLATLVEFGRRCDVVTVEHEWVDPDVLAAAADAGITLRPGAESLRALTDKDAQRRLLAELGIETPPFERARDRAELLEAIRRLDGRAVVKSARGGYDGRGVFGVDGHELASDLDALGPGPWLVEPRLEIERECAVQVVRGSDGSCVVYPVVETVQVDGMCRQVFVPAEIDDESARRARDAAIGVADATSYVGVLAVELFWTEGRLVVNELAPRVHNTGHYTIEACVASQFENHVRAVMGLPLSSTRLVVPAAAMSNVVATSSEPPDLRRVAPLDAAVHLYGKTARPGRKIGHVTACGHDVQRLREIADHVATALVDHGAAETSTTTRGAP